MMWAEMEGRTRRHGTIVATMNVVQGVVKKCRGFLMLVTKRIGC